VKRFRFHLNADRECIRIEGLFEVPLIGLEGGIKLGWFSLSDPRIAQIQVSSRKLTSRYAEMDLRAFHLEFPPHVVVRLGDVSVPFRELGDEHGSFWVRGDDYGKSPDESLQKFSFPPTSIRYVEPQVYERVLEENKRARIPAPPSYSQWMVNKVAGNCGAILSRASAAQFNLWRSHNRLL